MPARSLILCSLLAVLVSVTPAMAQKAPDPAGSAPEPVKPGDAPPETAPPSPGFQPVAPAPAPAPAPGFQPVTPEPAPTAEPEAPAPAASAPVTAASPTEGGAIGAALAAIETRLPDGDAEDFSALLAEAPEGVTGDTIGHLLFARRHIAPAAWFFGTEALADPSDPSSLSNFAAMAFELQMEDPETPDAALQAGALEAARAAAELAPEEAAVHNAHGNAARAAAELAEAIAAATRATELDPEEPLYWTNLARAHAAAGDTDAAAEALARARGLEPNGTAVLMTATALPAVRPSYLERQGAQCDVDFRCQEICPRSIIGGIMSVTCEIENMSAQMACQEGQPYPTSYNCQEDFPEYGILIPGLNSGFSVSMPGFSAHVLVDGDGTVRVRVEAGINRGRLGAYVGGDGSYSPTNGASFDEFRGGVRVNILPTATGGGSATDEAAGAWGHPPAHVELEGNSSGEATLGVEAYNAGLISN